MLLENKKFIKNILFLLDARNKLQPLKALLGELEKVRSIVENQSFIAGDNFIFGTISYVGKQLRHFGL